MFPASLLRRTKDKGGGGRRFLAAPIIGKRGNNYTVDSTSRAADPEKRKHAYKFLIG